jgi:hypothetical protein
LALTAHRDAIAHADAAVAAIDAVLQSAKESGVLAYFHHAYRRRRLAAPATWRTAILPVGSAPALRRLDQFARVDPKGASQAAQDCNACGNIRAFD